MRSKLRLAVFFFISSLPLLAWGQSAVRYQWVQFAPHQQILIRAITTDNHCPVLDWQDAQHRSHQQALAARGKPTAAFPVTVCEMALPVTTVEAAIDGHALPLKKSAITRIALVGDTGCRLKQGVKPQLCDDPQRWPFARVARQVAAWHPDLIIHLGDYVYRENACPAGDATCAHSPYGDNWKTWQADFLQPAQPLLQAAPLLFIRGNHETCNREGTGWTYLLDSFPFAPCQNHSPVYFVDGNDTRLFVLDSAMAADVGAGQVKDYEADLDTVQNQLGKNNWIITHKPFWFVVPTDTLGRWAQSYLLNTLQAAWIEVQPEKINLLVAGHIHRFEALGFAPDSARAPQLIAGNSGTRLDATLIPHNLAGSEVAGESVQAGIAAHVFGFVTLVQQGNSADWLVQLHDVDGKVVVECHLQHQGLQCGKRLA